MYIMVNGSTALLGGEKNMEDESSHLQTFTIVLKNLKGISK